MKITIEIIPHDQHRYSTVGDWLYDSEGNLIIRVSQLSDWRREMLIAVHELVEVLICKHDGVTQEQVDQFDAKVFNYAEHPDEEPGDDPGSPYKKQHCIATGVERVLAAALGVDWKPYEEELESLPELPDKT